VRELIWSKTAPAADQVREWCRVAAKRGLIHLVFEGCGPRQDLGWRAIEPWTRSRAVTVADLRESLEPGPLDVALCCDLVCLRPGVELAWGLGAPPPGVLWALGRAGRAALARGLLDPAPISAEEALRLGLAQRLLDRDAEIQFGGEVSPVALTTVRDVLRGATPARSSLELASFRLLFASGEPGEGAAAFLGRRPPTFGARGG
jgi:hypothetical protein